MKQIVTEKRMVEVEVPVMQQTDEGPFDSLLGKRVVVIGLNYIYDGILDRVNGVILELTDTSIVYETGKWSNKGQWISYEKLPTTVIKVSTITIESIFALEK